MGQQFTICLSDKDTELVLTALSNLPYNRVAGLIATIHSQVTEQCNNEN